MSNLVNILEEAQKHYESEMRNWKYAQECEDKNDLEGYNMFWSASEHESGFVRGLLFTYELETGKHIFGHQIKCELESIA